jgi:hydrogenase maturation factor
MPITADEVKDIIAAIKNIIQQLEGLQNKAEAEYGRVVPEGEPQPRPFRMR